MKYIQSVVIPLLVAILVGIGSSAVTSAIYIGRMDERLSSLEKHAGPARGHVHDPARPHGRPRAPSGQNRSDDGRRVADLREIKADVKSLCQGLHEPEFL